MHNYETLLALMVVVWLFGKIFRSLKLPVIFGELLGGVIVGPLVLNLVQADNEAVILLSELGIFFLMLHSGLETDPKELFKASKKSILIALGGVALPFVGGFYMARLFDQPLMSALFIGLGVSITAIAISVRLFKDYKIQNTPAAHISMGAIIMNDILALILFSIILDLHSTGSFSVWLILWKLIKIAVFFGVVMFIGQKTAHHLPIMLQSKGFTFTLITALTLGMIAEYIGLHGIIGAFLAGLFIRQEIVEEKIFRKIEDRIYGLSYSFLGPIFFASLAFYLEFSFISQPTFLFLFFGLLVVGFLGKFLGAGIMAYIQNISRKESIIIGLAMNSRGAIDLIIALIGRQQGIIGPEVFSILVMMAFVTTMISIFGMPWVLKRGATMKITE